MNTARDKTEYITPQEFRALQQRKAKQRKSTKNGRTVSSMPEVRENDIRTAIKEFLELHGWWVWINWQGPFSYRGITDLTAIKGGQVWWIEVKRPGEYLRPDQVKFMELMEEHGGNWLLARSIEDVEHLVRGGLHV